jgi:hypothetical protein
VNKGGRPKGIPNKVTPTVQTMIINQDEGREEEDHPHRQGVEPVQADRVRRAAAGMRMKALQSLMAGNSAAKSLGPVPSPGPGARLRTTLLLQRRRCKSRAGRPARRGVWAGAFVMNSGRWKTGGDVNEW